MNPDRSPLPSSLQSLLPSEESRPSHSVPWTLARPMRRLERIFGSGEMVERVRAFDWARTSLGPIEQWPETLLLTVNNLLASPHPMFLWWGSELLQFYNDAYRMSLRADKHPLALGQRGEDCWQELWHIISPQIQQVMSGGPAIWQPDIVMAFYRDGVLEDVHCTYAFSPVRNLEGEISGTLVTCMENTQRQRAEQTLREELQRFSELFEQAPVFFTVLRGPSHVFERINPMYQQLLGDRALIGLSVHDAVPEVEAQGFIDLLDHVYRSGEPFIGHDTVLKLARHNADTLDERIVDFVYRPMRNADGAVSGIMVVGIDVTEGKRAERALFQTEKLVAVGRLATTIAHEINNPLESVANLLYLIKGETHSPEAVLQHLEVAQEEVRRIANITINTLKFFRQTSKATPTVMEEVVASVLAMFEGRIKHSGITVSLRSRPHDTLMAFSAELRQVFANLLSNALDATPLGGSIRIRIHAATDHLTHEPGVTVVVADTGSGMSRQTATQIFEAFFTTKEVTGTGLGLWVSRELIDKHSGRIRLRSRQAIEHTNEDGTTGQSASGTVFRIFFPCQNGLAV